MVLSIVEFNIVTLSFALNNISSFIEFFAERYEKLPTVITGTSKIRANNV